MNARHDAPRTQREHKRQISDRGPGRRPVTGCQGGDAGIGGGRIRALACAAWKSARTRMTGYASIVYCTLGNAYQNLEIFSKALEQHKEHLTMAKEVGNRAGEGQAYGSLGVPKL